VLSLLSPIPSVFNLKMPRHKNKSNQKNKVVAVVPQKNKQHKQKNKNPAKSRSIISSVGNAVGSILGIPKLGTTASSIMSSITGRGAYKVRSNSFMNASDAIPQFDKNLDGSIVLSHREMVTDVLGSQRFNSNVYLIDPTVASTFPYLANVAINFEQFEFLGLVFCYNPTSGNSVASSNTALGTVIMATEYDVSKPVFGSKTEMESYEYCTSCVPSEPMLHPIECNPKLDVLNSRYVGGPARQFKYPLSTLPAISNVDSESAQLSLAANLQTLGRLQLATVGQQVDNSDLGELWVSYKIKLMKPRLPQTGLWSGIFHAGSTVGLTPTGAINASSTHPFTDAAIYSDSTMPLQPVTFQPNAQVVWINQLPPRTVLDFRYMCNGSGGTVNVGAVTLTNCTLVTNISSSVGMQSGPIYCGGGTAQTMVFFSIMLPDITGSNVVAVSFAPLSVTSGFVGDWDLFVTVRPVVDQSIGPGPLTSTARDELVSIRRQYDGAIQKLQDKLDGLTTLTQFLQCKPEEVKTPVDADPISAEWVNSLLVDGLESASQVDLHKLVDHLRLHGISPKLDDLPLRKQVGVKSRDPLAIVK